VARFAIAVRSRIILRTEEPKANSLEATLIRFLAKARFLLFFFSSCFAATLRRSAFRMALRLLFEDALPLRPIAIKKSKNAFTPKSYDSNRDFSELICCRNKNSSKQASSSVSSDLKVLHYTYTNNIYLQ
jgi:hypothetical protein